MRFAVRISFACLLWTGTVGAGNEVQDIAAAVSRMEAADTDPGRASVLDMIPEPERIAVLAALRTRAEDAFKKLDYIQALRSYDASLTIARQLGQPGEIARISRGIGLCYWREDKVPEALTAYESGLDAARQASDDSLQAEILRGIGVAERRLGEMPAATAADLESLRLARHAGDKMSTLQALNNLGAVYQSTGDQRKAILNYRQAIEIAGELRNPKLVDSIQHNIALCYVDQGDLEIALSTMTSLINSEAQRGDKDALMRELINLGILHRRLGQMKDAIADFDRAAALLTELHDQPAEVTLLLARAAANAAQKNWSSAANDLETTVHISRQISDALVESIALSTLSGIHTVLGKPEAGLEEAREALSLAQRIRASESIYAANLALAQAQIARGGKNEAIAALRTAISEIESWRGRLSGDEQNSQEFLIDKMQAFELLSGLLLERGDSLAALEIAERLKARSLLDVLKGGRVSVDAALTPAERSMQRRLIARLTAPAMGASAQGYTKEWEAAEQAMDVFHAGLYAAHPELQFRRGQSPPLTRAAIAGALPDASAAAVEYLVTDDYTLAFVVRRRGADVEIKGRKLAVQRTEIERLVKTFRDQLAARNLGYREEAAGLYQLLIAPLAGDLRNVSTLLIVPDGGLWALPFQALQAPNGHLLLEQCAIFYAPSINFLNMILHQPNRSAPRQVLLAVSSEHEETPEVERVRALYQGHASTISNRVEPEVAQWRREASSARILHIAGHGVLNSDSPLHSYLSIGGNQGSDQERILEAREVLELNLSADLAVLSACDTGRGRVHSGEGLVGMSWAFLAAGARSTLVSQWKVDAAATAQLMVGFHREISPAVLRNQGVRERARALQKAALELMRQPEYAHPYYWAGFVIVGDGY